MTAITCGWLDDDTVTRLESEIAAYITAVFSEMSEVLGNLRDESYIVVDEVPAAQWGYGGKTFDFYDGGGLDLACLGEARVFLDSATENPFHPNQDERPDDRST